jgi:hypothetical protein
VNRGDRSSLFQFATLERVDWFNNGAAPGDHTGQASHGGVTQTKRLRANPWGFMPMKVYFIYRSTAKENKKLRPAFYSKQLALCSFLRAIENMQQRSDIIFINDAPISAKLESIMELNGEIVNIVGLTLIKSYYTTIRFAKIRGWNDNDFAYFSEDDYLYHPDAFRSLIAAANLIECPSYFALYASREGREPNGSLIPRGQTRIVERKGEAIVAAGHEWRPAMSTTSTFGVHLRALRRDLWLHYIAPQVGGAWDHVISLAHKGHRPFFWRDVIEPFGRPEAGWRWAVKMAGVRATLNVGAMMKRIRWHPLMAPTRCLATHMELNYMATGVDWLAVAEETQRWAIEKGIIGSKSTR